MSDEPFVAAPLGMARDADVLLFLARWPMTANETTRLRRTLLSVRAMAQSSGTRLWLQTYTGSSDLAPVVRIDQGQVKDLMFDVEAWDFSEKTDLTLGLVTWLGRGRLPNGRWPTHMVLPNDVLDVSMDTLPHQPAIEGRLLPTSIVLLHQESPAPSVLTYARQRSPWASVYDHHDVHRFAEAMAIRDTAEQIAGDAPAAPSRSRL